MRSQSIENTDPQSAELGLEDKISTCPDQTNNARMTQRSLHEERVETKVVQNPRATASIVAQMGKITENCKPTTHSLKHTGSLRFKTKQF